MHITFWLDSPAHKITLPSANLHMLQAAIYSLLPSDKADFLHNEGYNVKGRTMKLFALGWPASDTRPIFEHRRIILTDPMRITISTPFDDTANDFVAGAMRAGHMRLGNELCEVVKAELQRQIAQGNSLIVRTLSPVTCYSASVMDSGKSFTHYYAPNQPEFTEFIRKNAARKFLALNPERDMPPGNLDITPLGTLKERISLYDQRKLMPIKGWWGKFRLDGPEELLQTVLDCGLGAKNSGGWGCVTKAE